MIYFEGAEDWATVFLVEEGFKGYNALKNGGFRTYSSKYCLYNGSNQTKLAPTLLDKWGK